MIYTVECSFNDSTKEAERNEFYSKNKLPALISVKGFLTSQRFIALSDNGPRYLAIHSIIDTNVLTSQHYKEAGGGNFAKWQKHIIDWHRNIYSMARQAPCVVEGEYLLLSEDSPEGFLNLGLEFIELKAIALDKKPARRWLAVSNNLLLEEIKSSSETIQIYRAMGKQLTSS